MAGNATLDPVDNPERPRSPKRYLVAVRLVALVATVLIVALACRSLLNHLRKSRPVEATSTDPAIAVRQERVVNGVSWGLSYEAALEQGAAEGTPVLVYFASRRTADCWELEQSVFTDSEVTPWLSQFVRVQLHEDIVLIASLSQAQQMQLARENVGLQLNLREETATPSLMILTPQGAFVTKRDGYQSPRDLAAFLKRALAQAQHQMRQRSVGG